LAGEERSAFWSVTHGTQYCHLSHGGQCVTDGFNMSYVPQERCIFRANVPLTVSSTEFNLEANFDFIRTSVGTERRASAAHGAVDHAPRVLADGPCCVSLKHRNGP
jgi:hypothetical protein